VPSLERICGAVTKFPHPRRTAVYSAAGDRRDDDLIAQGRLLAATFDRVVIYEDAYIRGRQPGEITKLITQGVREGMRGDKPVRIDVGGDWATSAALVLDAVGKGDLVLLQPDTIEQAMPWLAERYGNRLKEAVLDEIAGTAPPAADPAPVVAKADEAVPAASRPGAFAALVSELESGARSGFARAPTGGIVFQKLAYPVLSAGGRMDLALDLLLARGMPSVAYWMDSGVQTTPATTLWERWQSTATELRGWSFNHIMMGGFGSWLYTDVAGLGRVPGSTSWSELNVAPPQVLPPRLNLTAAAATLDTALGPVEVSWRAPGAPPSAFALRARVPAGARATVRVPIGARAPAAVNITESGAPVWRAGAFSPVDGVVAAAAADGYVSFDVGSGDYDFELFAAAEAVS
jgi:hypothetical protein